MYGKDKIILHNAFNFLIRLRDLFKLESEFFTGDMSYPTICSATPISNGLREEWAT